MKTANATWAIWLSLLAALVLHAFPLPWEWRWYRPEFVLLVLLYWNLALPHRVGIFSAAVTGFSLDLVNGTAVGPLAVGAVVSTLIVLLNYQRIRHFDALLQSLTMALLVGLTLVIERWIHNMLGVGAQGLAFIYPIPLTAVFWLGVRNILRALRRYYEVE